MNTHPIIIGISGASGSILGFRLAGALLAQHIPVELILSEKALRVMRDELPGLKLTGGGSDEKTDALFSYFQWPAESRPLLTLYANQDIGAACASGTHLNRAMVVIPCSMGTLAKIAHGISDNLLTRAADVIIKEKRTLLLVPRETPFSAIHLQNMLSLSQLGVSIIPPVLSFYLPHFDTLDGQIDYTLGKVLDQLGLEHTLHPRWC